MRKKLVVREAETDLRSECTSAGGDGDGARDLVVVVVEVVVVVVVEVGGTTLLAVHYYISDKRVLYPSASPP